MCKNNHKPCKMILRIKQYYFECVFTSGAYQSTRNKDTLEKSRNSEQN